MSSTPNAPRRRNRYNAEMLQRVRQVYPRIRTAEQKRRFAKQLGMRSEKQLYNLASRLEITRDMHDRLAGGEIHPDEAYDPCLDPERLLIRDDPRNPDLFDGEDDAYLRDTFGQQQIAEISWVLGKSESAVMLRARQLGLRRPVHYWPLDRVLAWLGCSERELVQLLRLIGRDNSIHRCCDRQGRVRIALIESSALARAISKNGVWRILVEKRNADLCFVYEILGAESEVAQGRCRREDNHWVSHGHTCLNPFSGISFGLFYDGTDPKLVGAELRPEQLAKDLVGDLIDHAGEHTVGGRLPLPADPAAAQDASALATEDCPAERRPAEECPSAAL